MAVAGTTAGASMRVYDADLVDEFVAALEAEVEAMRAEILELRCQLVAAPGEGSSDEASAEQIVGRALIDAQHLVDAIVASAEEEAAARLADADERCRRMIEDSHARAGAIKALPTDERDWSADLEAERRELLDAAGREARAVLAGAEAERIALLGAARDEADRIIADAQRGADGSVGSAIETAEERAMLIEEARREARRILSRAQVERLSIIEEARLQAEADEATDDATIERPAPVRPLFSPERATRRPATSAWSSSTAEVSDSHSGPPSDGSVGPPMAVGGPTEPQEVPLDLPPPTGQPVVSINGTGSGAAGVRAKRRRFGR